MCVYIYIERERDSLAHQWSVKPDSISNPSYLFHVVLQCRTISYHDVPYRAMLDRPA